MSNPKKEFSKMYDRYIDRIYRFVLLKVGSIEIAEDLTAETFLRGWNFFKEKEEKIDNPQAFLYQIAKNLIADFYRKEGGVQLVSDENLQISDPKEDLEKKANLNSDFRVIQQAMANLNEDYQNVIVWRYINDLPIKKVATLLDKPESTTRVTIHRAIKSLKREIDKKDIKLG
jgi:RNA polymerase sigma-70 factor (ECF subfamily)